MKLKNKLKNKIQESKTKQFIDEHKRGIRIGLVLIPLSALGIANLKLQYDIIKLSNYLGGYRKGFQDGLMTLSDGIDKAFKTNNITPELHEQLAKDTAKIVEPIVQKVFKD